MTDTGIQLLKSHTVLHISQQSLALDSHLQSLPFLALSHLSKLRPRLTLLMETDNYIIAALTIRHVPVCHGSACLGGAP